MKKNLLIIIFIVLSIFIVIGCSNSKNNTTTGSNIEKEKETYIKYVQKLEKIDESTENIPFDIDIIYDKLDDEEIRYQVIIDNPTIDIKNVKALAIHNMQTDDIFPSIGIFDETIDLNKDNDELGIILVGYIPYSKSIEDFKCEMKVLISYEIEEKRVINYYVTKN